MKKKSFRPNVSHTPTVGQTVELHTVSRPPFIPLRCVVSSKENALKRCQPPRMTNPALNDRANECLSTDAIQTKQRCRVMLQRESTSSWVKWGWKIYNSKVVFFRVHNSINFYYGSHSFVFNWTCEMWFYYFFVLFLVLSTPFQ